MSEETRQDKSNKLLCDSIQEMRDVCALDLFPEKYDFEKVCSCTECFPIITGLKKFEKEIRSKKALVMEYRRLLESKCNLCGHINIAVNWTRHMLDLFHNNLKRVSVSGDSLTLHKSKYAAELEEIKSGITKMLSRLCLLDESWATDGRQQHVVFYDIPVEIESGLFYYGRTKAKDAAHKLLKKILEIEEEHERAKKSVGALALDPSISMEYIEDQIKCIEMLPVETFLPEIKELSAEILPMYDSEDWLRRAKDDIDDTCRDMIRIRNMFWRRYQASHDLTSSGEGHSVSGLNGTLVSLRQQVNSIKYRWENDYTPSFTPFERAHPKTGSHSKRQRI